MIRKTNEQKNILFTFLTSIQAHTQDNTTRLKNSNNYNCIGIKLIKKQNLTQNNFDKYVDTDFRAAIFGRKKS